MATSKPDLSGHYWSNAKEAGQMTRKMALLLGNAVKHNKIQEGNSQPQQVLQNS